MRVLLVEDDTYTAESIELMLCKSGYNVTVTESGEEALYLTKSKDFDIVLLDLKLGDIPGHEVLNEIRNAGIRLPVLILSGLGHPDQKIKGLTSGADDYLTKPFHKEELIARINAIVRRVTGHSNSLIETGELTVDLDRKIATVSNKRLELTKREYGVLELLALKKGATVIKETFLDYLYGGLDEPSEKVVDVFIHNLRKKIQALSGDEDYIRTVWGRGYTLVDLSEDHKPDADIAGTAA